MTGCQYRNTGEKNGQCRQIIIYVPTALFSKYYLYNLYYTILCRWKFVKKAPKDDLLNRITRSLFLGPIFSHIFRCPSNLLDKKIITLGSRLFIISNNNYT
uniref:Uncharacterized protein n=1 Tax=Cacopsylla melanoneura TaxID=428564 RepID=A0A8D8LGF6_9HEMI